MHAMTVAVDLAKTVFELAVANGQWRLTARHRFNRRQCARFLSTTPATHIVMEACGTAHDWGRVAQGHGHRVTLVPPAYVRPYVRRNKTDRADAEALLEAVRSGQMPSVPVKRVEQQALVALHRVREQWMKTRTARINTLRGILREHGLLLPAGPRAAVQAVPAIPGRCRAAAAVAPAARAGERARRGPRHRSPHRGTRARPADLGRRRPGRTALARDPRHWALDRDGPGRDRGAYRRLPTGSPVCQLVGAHPTRALQWASPASRWDHQTRGPLPPLPAHPWGARGARLCPAPAIQGAAAQSLASLGGDPPGPARPQQSDDCGRQ